MTSKVHEEAAGTKCIECVTTYDCDESCIPPTDTICVYGGILYQRVNPTTGLLYGFLTQGKLFSIKDKIAVIEGLKAKNLVEAAEKYLKLENLVLIASGPEDSSNK